MIMKKQILFYLLILTQFSYGQLTTSTAAGPAGLVNNVLLGPGVTVSNISYSGSGTAIGSFNAAGTNLGITSGIVMTTGTILNNGNGPQGPNNVGNSGLDNGNAGYGPLTTIIGGTTTYDAAVLEFDFVPYSDTVKFRYVFGSEEYPEFVGSTYNDAFAFFISGPGISGQQNIAKLSNGTPVTINNINGSSNAAYYVSNGDGSQSPYNSSNSYIQYDGFTKVLEAKSKVQCGQTYHLVICLADAGDGKYDSGIFLQANSLESKVPVEIDYALSFAAFTNPDVMAEGCVSTTVTLKRGGSTTSSLTIPVNVSGTAIEGVDYSDIPNTMTFAAGQTQIQFTINSLTDAITEGLETLTLNFPIADPCGNITPIIINLGIDDEVLTVSVESAEVLCPGDELEIVANTEGGSGLFTYLWNTGATTASIFVSPTATASYTVTVTDNCYQTSVSDVSVITVPVYLPVSLNETADITEICPYVPQTLEANASGGAGNYTYVWTATELPALGTDSTQFVTPFTTTGYTVEVVDQCGDSQIAYIVYNVLSPPLLLEMTPLTKVCPGDSVQISVIASGGHGDYNYFWALTGDTTATIWVKPSFNTTYEVSVSDSCREYFSVEGTTTVQIVRPTANFQVSSKTIFEDLPITFQNLTAHGDTYTWYFGDGNMSTLVHPNNTYDLPGIYDILLIAKDTMGCVDSIIKSITIQEEYYVYIPNTFTADGSRFNETFSVSTIGIESLKIQIFNRWGEMVYSSTDLRFEWDGKYKEKAIKEGVYTYIVECVTNSKIDLYYTGHVTILK